MPNFFQLTVLFSLLFILTLSDIKYNLIPNRMVYIGTLSGLTLSFLFNGIPGIGTALLGLITGFSLLFPFYLVGAMGAGDIKLMAMCGAFLDPAHTLLVVLLSILTGGVYALVVLALAGSAEILDYMQTVLDRQTLRTNEASPGKFKPPITHIPYAPSITCGTLITILDPFFIQPLKLMLGI